MPLKNKVFIYPGDKRNSGAEESAIIATHLILAVENEGMDSCWLDLFDPGKTVEILGLHENKEIIMLLDLVYADEGEGSLLNSGCRIHNS